MKATPKARPTKAELAAAHGATIPDVIAPDLDVLFCGINPGLYSGYTGHHFARPGNRFWPALHRSGWTPRQLRPDEQHLLPEWGMGITNIVARATARADELTAEELRAGGDALHERLERYRPRMLAVLGVTAYRSAFGRPKAQIGSQTDRIGHTPVWVLPNPSGLNASWPVDAIAEELIRVRRRCRGDA
ncbi:G/U mismatch-specific DNA glycosylase [Nocardiopsis gilva YIM 90087]|uniref:G/U mismatch-specific DNA glycosylase n=1 Tax=Nocardiopsis gilva YIM 90087 TaxID=1235441 RepID=A0A223S8L1_9ACTN|nr:G/U mismatch-specific DNA glycosylase [Nocardiopsis gilva]ASU84455.1 G/U mismatch-specific DNA glycosylase [Nocardiopsis gilva YIM 90087]